ncbi:MAG: DUF1330 domain-containing protein [Candidatus Acidiferrales bacterium]
MSAYAIFIRERVRDADAIDAYKKLAKASFAGQPVKFLATAGKHETLEGPTAENVLLLEFPTLADAKAWYFSPAYRDASKLRHQGGDYRVLFLESND